MAISFIGSKCPAVSGVSFIKRTYLSLQVIVWPQFIAKWYNFVEVLSIYNADIIQYHINGNVLISSAY